MKSSLKLSRMTVSKVINLAKGKEESLENEYDPTYFK